MAPMIEPSSRTCPRSQPQLWERLDSGMVAPAGDLPEVDGVLVRATFEHMIERMRPPKGDPWPSREHRMADALVELCRDDAQFTAVSGPTPPLIVEVPMEGPATVAGIPLPDQIVECRRAQAKIEPVLVDGTGSR